MFIDGSEKKPVNVVVLSDVNDKLSEEEAVDRSIEVPTIVENEKQTVDSSIEETPVDCWRHLPPYTLLLVNFS